MDWTSGAVRVCGADGSPSAASAGWPWPSAAGVSGGRESSTGREGFCEGPEAHEKRNAAMTVKRKALTVILIGSPPEADSPHFLEHALHVPVVDRRDGVNRYLPG